MQDAPKPTDHTTLLAHAPWVARLARRLIADAHLADDLTQDVLTAAIERPPAFSQNPQHLRRWLSGVTRHLAARVHRRESERASRESHATAAPPPSCDPTLERLELHHKLVALVLGLDEPYRSVVTLRFLERKSVRQIARQLGVETATVRQRLSRAMAQLRRRLDADFDGDREAWCLALGGLLGALPAVATPVAVAASLLLAATLLGAFGLHVGNSASPSMHPDRSAGPAALASSPVQRAAAPPLARSTPRAQRQLVDSTATGANSVLSITVTKADGTPAQEAKLLILALDIPTEVTPAASRILERTHTDSAGRVSLQARPGSGLVLAQTASAPPVVLRLEQLTGSHTIQLATSGSLSGWLVEDGHTPVEPIPLELSAFTDPFPDLDKSALAELEGAGIRLRTLKLTTDANGWFEVDNLPADWDGTLRLPGTHWFLDTPDGIRIVARGDAVELAAAQRELTFAVTRLPSIRGRLVDDATGQPLPNHPMMVYTRFEDGGTTPSTGTRTDERGSFVVGIHPSTGPRDSHWRDPSTRPAIASLRLDILASGGFLARRLFFSQADLGTRGDLGDLALTRGQDLFLLILDEQGNPVPGAQASLGPSSTQCQPSGADGLLHVSGVMPSSKELELGAPKMRPTMIELDPEPTSKDAPLVVSLERGSRLDLVVVTSPPEAAEKLELQIRGKRRLFEIGSPGIGTLLNNALGSARMSFSNWSDEDGYQTHFRSSETGRYTLLGLAPSVPIEVELIGPNDRVLLRTVLETPALGETEFHELLVTEPAYDLEVHVRDTSGQPVRHAWVSLSGESVSAAAYTDAQGIAHLSNLFAPPGLARLKASSNGYASPEFEGIRVAPDVELPDLVLERGRSVELTVLDESGEAVPIETATASTEGYTTRPSTPTPTGQRFFRDLPPGLIEFEVLRGGRSFHLEHDTATPEATMVLPNFGQLVVDLAAPLLIDEQSWYRLRITSLDSEAITLEFSLNASEPSVTTDLLPGRYQLQLMLDPDESSPTLLDTATIEVRPHATSHASLDH